MVLICHTNCTTMPNQMYYHATPTRGHCRVERNSEFSAIYSSITGNNVSYIVVHCSVKFWFWQVRELIWDMVKSSAWLATAPRNCTLHTATELLTPPLHIAYSNCRCTRLLCWMQYCRASKQRRDKTPRCCFSLATRWCRPLLGPTSSSCAELRPLKSPKIVTDGQRRSM